jgi:hypothetical protein
VHLLLHNRRESKKINFLHAAKRLPHAFVKNILDPTGLRLIIVMCVICSLNKRAIDDSSKKIFSLKNYDFVID